MEFIINLSESICKWYYATTCMILESYNNKLSFLPSQVLWYNCHTLHTHAWVCAFTNTHTINPILQCYVLFKRLSFSVSQTSLVAQVVRSPPAMQETRVWSLDQEDLLEKGMDFHSNIIAWRIPWTKIPLQH